MSSSCESDQKGVWGQVHPAQVGKILYKIGWSRQKPMTRASQRDEVAIATWGEREMASTEKRQETRAEP